MPKPTVDGNEILQDLHFPKSGLDVVNAFCKQPNRPAANGEYARTTPTGNNVRGFDPSTGRSRGGARSGLVKYIPAQPGATTFITQQLDFITTVGDDTVQPSQSGRVVTLVVVSQGNVFYAVAGATSWTAAINNTANSPPLNFTGIMFSAANNQKLWFADGTNYCYFDPNTGSVEAWVASSGTLPVDASNNTPRLICTWRGRTVLSGLLLDPQDIFFSAISDPTNFNYAPSAVPISTQAISLETSPMGLVADVVTALIPYTDDLLVVGGQDSLYMIQGDPMAGGQIALISATVGIAFGEAWTMDPYGVIYFVSNKMGIYTLVPGNQPQRISQPIEPLLANVDTGLNSIRMLWDDAYQGCHVYITPLASAQAATHFFYDVRAGAWFTDTFANVNLNPLCCVTFNGNTADDRVALIGSWDGYVRAVNPTATDDDGTPIQSEVLIGPLVTSNLSEILVKDMQAVLGEASGSVTYGVQIDSTAEIASTSAPVVAGTWNASRNYLTPVRRAGHAIYVTISSVVAWSLESIRIRISTQGKVRERGK